MTAYLLPVPKQSFRDSNGTPLVAGTVETYVPGTTTIRDTYQDSGQVTLNTHPIILDARGEAVMWGNGAYRIVVRDASGNLIYDQIADVTTIKGDKGDKGAKGDSASVIAFEDFGGVGDGVTSNTLAWASFVQMVLSTGKRGIIGPGRFMIDSASAIDLAPQRTKGITIEGAAGQQTVLDFSRVPPANGTIPLTFYCSTGATFYHEFSNIAVMGNAPGPVMALGRPASGTSFPDELNECRFNGLIVNNMSTNPAAQALALNGLYNCDFFVICNCAGYGSSMALGQVAFCTIRGSFGTADRALDFITGYSYGNAFMALDLEVVNTCVRFLSPFASQNTFLGGTLVWSNGSGTPVAGIDGQAGNNNLFIGMNPSSAGNAVKPGSVGVIFDNVRAGDRQFGNIYGNSLTINPSWGDADLTLDAISGNARFAVLKRSGVVRWELGANNAPENGGNTGSDVIFQRFSDNGNVLDIPLSIARGSGITTLASAAIGSFGAFGNAPLTVRPTVSGSRGGNQAVSSILNALVQLGLITDSTGV